MSLWSLHSGDSKRGSLVLNTVFLPLSSGRIARTASTVFRLAQVLAIISIFVYGTAFVLGFIMLYCCSFFRWICVTLNIVGAVTLCLVWMAMVVTYRTDEEPFCPEEKRYHTYGSGFVLFVLAWLLDFLNIVSLLLPF
nr:unnamed protein product [Leishmania braziliensis]